VALRPCVIYGERDRNILPTLSRICRMRIVPLPKAGRRILDLVHISDVVEAVLAAAIKPKAVGRAYNITDNEMHTYRDILMAYGKLAERKLTILPIPGRAFVLPIQMVLRMMQMRRTPGDWTGQIKSIRMFDLDIHYATDAAYRDLGYVPQVGLTEGLERTWKWSLEQQANNGKD